jgi:hypothetical protein
MLCQVGVRGPRQREFTCTTAARSCRSNGGSASIARRLDDRPPLRGKESHGGPAGGTPGGFSARGRDSLRGRAPRRHGREAGRSPLQFVRGRVTEVRIQAARGGMPAYVGESRPTGQRARQILPSVRTPTAWAEGIACMICRVEGICIVLRTATRVCPRGRHRHGGGRLEQPQEGMQRLWLTVRTSIIKCDERRS